ncbi:MAG: mechanosensitive ion channel, partial [Acetatifactor sp.]|nr:mechanosensitive ion channel [Acetatifactor sp.]
MNELSTTVTVCIIIIATLVIGLLHRVLYKLVPPKHLFWLFLNNIIQGVIYVVGFMFAVSAIPQLSRLSTTLLAGSGIVALAVSLSAQESLSNIVSGLFISLFRPFNVGDRIKLISSGVVGHVESITLRHTIIKTLTNTRITVPNSVMNK